MTEHEPDSRTAPPGLFGWALRHPGLAKAAFAVPILAVILGFFVYPMIRGAVDRVRWEAILDDSDFRPGVNEEGIEWGIYEMKEFLARRLGVKSRTIQGTGTPVLVFEGRDEVLIHRDDSAAAAARSAEEWTASPAPGEDPASRRHVSWGAFVFSGRGDSAGIDRILTFLSEGR